jgi:hypothetical protein
MAPWPGHNVVRVPPVGDRASSAGTKHSVTSTLHLQAAWVDAILAERHTATVLCLRWEIHQRLGGLRELGTLQSSRRSLSSLSVTGMLRNVEPSVWCRFE